MCYNHCPAFTFNPVSGDGHCTDRSGMERCGLDEDGLERLDDELESEEEL